jgi:UDP-glucose 4-epimerase
LRVKVLIAGGAGFIGSTVASACLDSGITPVIVDNLSTGRVEFVRDRIFYQGDVSDGPLIDKIFGEHADIAAVVHLTEVIVVPDSVANPLRYYRENVARTVEFVDHVVRNGCSRLLFSSSAAIYAPAEDMSVDEASALDPQSPCARTKMVVEQLLADCTAAYQLKVLSLRYFNPIGADPQLRTGLQLPRPTHLLGKLLTAVENDEEFLLTGVDWPTRDGSAVRDFIHVWDLAAAHVAALRRFDEVVTPAAPYQVINIATGSGTTVKEFVAAFREASDKPLRVRETVPRPGDNTGCYSRSVRARELLGWQTQFSVSDGIRDSIRWAAIRRDRLGS